MRLSPPEGSCKYTPHCGPVAIAATIGTDVGTVMDLFREMYHKRGNWKGRSYFFELSGFLSFFGYDNRTYNMKRSCTLEKWVDLYSVWNARYILRTGGHFVAVHRGIVTDQSECCPASEHHSRRKIVKNVMEVSVE